MKIYTKKGDDGTTGLLYGGRVAKDSDVMAANGAVDEAQAFLGLARAEVAARAPAAEGTGEGAVHDLLVRLEAELWVLMAELATSAQRRDRLVAGTSLVTAEMVTSIEALIDEVSGRFTMPKEFVVPGQDRLSALLDVARTVVRRAERHAVGLATNGWLPPSSQVVAYLNRLSDLLWVMARAQEDEHLLTRSTASKGRT
ncbi:MAG: cob(I)yrinic acid a,c-diamide adenosyltransferase [Actinomycetota bacterium]|nr:cob(I)yrinic acid a,c-diamide adenosyltransferase [Actinomycetota bacterium]